MLLHVLKNVRFSSLVLLFVRFWLRVTELKGLDAKKLQFSLISLKFSVKFWKFYGFDQFHSHCSMTLSSSIVLHQVHFDSTVTGGSVRRWCTSDLFGDCSGLFGYSSYFPTSLVCVVDPSRETVSSPVDLKVLNIQSSCGQRNTKLLANVLTVNTISIVFFLNSRDNSVLNWSMLSVLHTMRPNSTVTTWYLVNKETDWFQDVWWWMNARRTLI